MNSGNIKDNLKYFIRGWGSGKVVDGGFLIGGNNAFLSVLILVKRFFVSETESRVYCREKHIPVNEGFEQAT
ncbi:hypothetical protein SAMN05661012_05736 [Chitinophaga sancti]|uniref:Uncharacterized protein n=1 Tax=Chitinophaga sancti TaxID=1004 RepID=A0A1K1SM65_9BACT|nr:hypothetical protein SAMN05661012_05736 [Chitinophaga sancti]